MLLELNWGLMYIIIRKICCIVIGRIANLVDSSACTVDLLSVLYTELTHQQMEISGEFISCTRLGKKKQPWKQF